MAKVFVRIELKGNPGQDVYTKLHEELAKLNWRRRIVGTAGETPLPSAMYQAEYYGDLSSLVASFHKNLIPPIWPQGSAVLAMQAEDWVQQGWWEPS